MYWEKASAAVRIFLKTKIDCRLAREVTISICKPPENHAFRRLMILERFFVNWPDWVVSNYLEMPTT